MELIGIDNLIYKAEIEIRHRQQVYGYQEGKGGWEELGLTSIKS